MIISRDMAKFVQGTHCNAFVADNFSCENVVLISTWYIYLGFYHGFYMPGYTLYYILTNLPIYLIPFLLHILPKLCHPIWWKFIPSQPPLQ